MKYIKFLLLSMLLYASYAFSATSQIANQASSNLSEIFIYKFNSGGFPEDLTLYLDNQFVGYLSSKSHIKILVSAATHSLKVIFKGQDPYIFTIETTPNSSHFYRAEYNLLTKSLVAEVLEDTAKTELSSLKTSSPEISLIDGKPDGYIGFNSRKYSSSDFQYQPTGLGKVIYPPEDTPHENNKNIATYEGEYLYGRPNGEGQMLLKDKINIKGFWSKGYLTSAFIEYPNGATFEGQISGNSFNGDGTFKTADGKVYEGKFKNGKSDGVGVYTDTSGITLKGVFKNGKFVSGAKFDKVGNQIAKFENGKDLTAKSALNSQQEAIQEQHSPQSSNPTISNYSILDTALNLLGAFAQGYSQSASQRNDKGSNGYNSRTVIINGNTCIENRFGSTVTIDCL